jgi:anaerobic magnesium-protoporphyrin IX monomethyl ester cyclase
VKLLFIYINPTGRTAIPPNISILIGYLKSRSNHVVQVFDTSFYEYELGKPVIEASWSPSYFLPAPKWIGFPELKKDLYKDLDAEILDFSPDLIAISCYSNQYSIVTDILKHLKEKFIHIKNIVGGCHPSFVPEEVIANPYIDMICLGEGEETLLELCDKLHVGKDICDIRNLWVKNKEGVRKNSLRAPTDFDEIGEPDWSVFDPVHIYQPFHGSYFRVGMVEFGRGCPFQCTYCANNRYLELYKEYKRSYFRHRNPAKFIDMLKNLVQKYDLELIYFQDGTFLTMSDEILKELAELYQKEIDLPCIILTTVTSITEKRLQYLKKMRCLYINMGIEAGNPEFRANILNRKMSDEQIIKAFELVRKHKIYSASYNVIGFPWETREDIFKTIELNRICNADSIYPQIFYPIEGCDLKKRCIEKGMYNIENESVYSQINDVGNVSILENLSIGREEIHGLLRTFYLYVKMPKALYPMIRLLEADNAGNRETISFLSDYYKRQEPHFADVKSLKYQADND